MSNEDVMKPNLKSGRILVVYAMGHPPDRAALEELLSVKDIELAIHRHSHRRIRGRWVS